MIRMLVFFFSSRRRHTRLQGDWSSDVCSSDLTISGCGSVPLFILSGSRCAAPPLFILPISRCGSAPLFILPISRCSSARAFYTYQFFLRQRPRFFYCPFLVAAAPPFFYTAHFSLRQRPRSEEHTSELQSPCNLVCRLLLEKKTILSHFILSFFSVSTNYF